MGIWGTVLGAGIFTYNPHATLYILYISIGLLYTPTVGLMVGGVFGISRALSSIAIAIRQLKQQDDKLTSLIERAIIWKSWSHRVNGLALVLFLIYIVLSL